MSLTAKPGSRFPMKSLVAQDNIPVSHEGKSVQLGMELFAKRRDRSDRDADPPPKRSKLEQGINNLKKSESPQKGYGESNKPHVFLCHQCGRIRQKSDGARCTFLKESESEAVERCPLWFCEWCHKRNYGETLLVALSRMEWVEGHDEYEKYTWICPHCRGICTCAKCHERRQLKEGLQIQALKASQKKGNTKEDQDSKDRRPSGLGIQAFFKRIDTGSEVRMPGAPKFSNEVNPAGYQPVKQAKPKRLHVQKEPVVKHVDPPPFHAVRASTNDDEFVYRLKVREFVLKFEKIFTRKLHVPTKHIVQLADPCTTPPALTMKHLYVALLKIIQVDIPAQEEERMKQTLKLVEKSPAGHENILKAVVEWLTMDPKHIPKADEAAAASKLIDRAIGTSVCRDELDAQIEKLKTLKSENSATAKALRLQWEERKSELHKERLRTTDKELVDQLIATLAQVDDEYKTEILRLSNELWIESRRLAPRTSCLGTDILGNKYWLFSSRKTKEREFGGWIVVQTPNSSKPTGELISSISEEQKADESEDPYSDLRSWYYVDKAVDIRQLAGWTTYLAAKAAAEETRREKKPLPKGSPNKLGQAFAVEIPVRVKRRGRKVPAPAGFSETRLLCEELIHAAEWVEERWPVVEEEVGNGDEKEPAKEN